MEQDLPGARSYSGGYKMIAFIFPGQGSQSVGMGKNLAKDFASAREIFLQADETLNFSLSQLCWEGPEDELRKTVNAQPAILTASIAAYKVLIEEGIHPKIVAGHSVGEYSALVAAEAISFSEAVKLVRKRGEAMHVAGLKSPGTMAAIIGLTLKEVEEICNLSSASSNGVVEIANINCPGQVVISGDVNTVKNASRLAKEKGARRTIELAVSGAFHSKLMEEAVKELNLHLSKINFQKPKFTVVANLTGRPIEDPAQIKDILSKQIRFKVLWEDSMRWMLNEGVDTVIEVGPGQILCGLFKKTDRRIKTFNVEDSFSLKKTINAIREKNDHDS